MFHCDVPLIQARLNLGKRDLSETPRLRFAIPSISHLLAGWYHRSLYYPFPHLPDEL